MSSRRENCWHSGENGGRSRSQTVQTYGYNHGVTLKIQWYFLNEICTVNHSQAILRERQFEEVLLEVGREKVRNWECLLVHRQQGLFLSVWVEDINHVWFTNARGCTQRECKLCQANGRMCLGFSSHRFHMKSGNYHQSYRTRKDTDSQRGWAEHHKWTASWRSFSCRSHRGNFSENQTYHKKSGGTQVLRKARIFKTLGRTTAPS